MRSPHVVLDQVDIASDDERSVASAGLLLPATLAERLGSSRSPISWSISGTGRARLVRDASCSRWSMRWLPVGTASMTWTCCAAGPPERCLATG
jgi:hypothetical protein